MNKSFIILLLSCSFRVHAQDYIRRAMLNAPVFYSGTINGSGIFVSDTSHVYFVTARHNLYSDRSPYKLVPRKATLSFYPQVTVSDTPETIEIDLREAEAKGAIQYDSLSDVVVMLIASFKRIPSGSLQYYPFITKYKAAYLPAWLYAWSDTYKDVEPGDNINIFSYPLSLGLMQTEQFDYRRPLLRKGEISGKYEKPAGSGKHQTIIIHGPVYTGNIGGPVFEVKNTSKGEKISLIGVVTGAVQMNKLLNNQNPNSEYSIVAPMDDVLELINLLK